MSVHESKSVSCCTHLLLQALILTRETDHFHSSKILTQAMNETEKSEDTNNLSGSVYKTSGAINPQFSQEMNAAFNAPGLNTIKSFTPSHRCTSNRENKSQSSGQ